MEYVAVGLGYLNTTIWYSPRKEAVLCQRLRFFFALVGKDRPPSEIQTRNLLSTGLVTMLCIYVLEVSDVEQKHHVETKREICDGLVVTILKRSCIPILGSWTEFFSCR
jgi:hypothetical protein